MIVDCAHYRDGRRQHAGKMETAEAAAIFRGLFEASTYIDLKRLPELFCGFPRLRSHGPTFYPVACSPQAWAAGATLSLVGSCLGIGFDPENEYVIFDQPVLPGFVEGLTVRQLGLGPGTIDVRLTRANEHVALHVLARRAGDRERNARAAAVRDRMKLLSERERQVMDGLVAGKANKIIAYDLGISARTVEIYRANVMTKMQADSLSALVRMVLLEAGPG